MNGIKLFSGHAVSFDVQEEYTGAAWEAIKLVNFLSP